MSDFSKLSDLALVGLLKGGEEQAFSEIYRRYAATLMGFASARLSCLDDARDIIHDIFLKMWLERADLQIDRNLQAYLYKLVRYRVIDKIRKNDTRLAHVALGNLSPVADEAPVEQQIASRDLARQLELSLLKLSPRVREIYRLSREEHLSISEIALRLQLSEQTVKNQLSTALQHLRSSLKIISIILLSCVR